MKKATYFFVLTTLWIIGWVIGIHYHEQITGFNPGTAFLWVVAYIGTLAVWSWNSD